MEPMNHVENLGSPRSLCLFPTNPKPENIRCRRNNEDTRRLSSASSQAARPLGRTAAALAVEWTSRTHRGANVRYKTAQIRQLSDQEREQTQASLGAAYMGLISGAHRGMNWRGLLHEFPGGARRFASVYTEKPTRRGLSVVIARNYRRIVPVDGCGHMNRVEREVYLAYPSSYN